MFRVTRGESHYDLAHFTLKKRYLKAKIEELEKFIDFTMQKI